MAPANHPQEQLRKGEREALQGALGDFQTVLIAGNPGIQTQLPECTSGGGGTWADTQ